MSEKSIQFPDFEEYAKSLKHLLPQYVAAELKKIFEQGYYLGRRDEADEWWKAQDIELATLN